MTDPKPLRLVPATKPQKATHTVVDTIVITPEIVKTWRAPPFQRSLRVNEKVVALAIEIKETECLPGIITLGVLGKETYILDGQHRREAFLLSGLPEGFTDIRVHHVTSFADMGEEFVKLNSSLVRLRPDDILRGLEASMPTLRRIRQHAGFVGYDQVRRGNHSPILSMSTLLRVWNASAMEVPSAAGSSAASLAKRLSLEEADLCGRFLGLAERAWGRDVEYQRLWGALNLCVCAWLWRRTVLHRYSPKSAQLSDADFTKAMMALSADAGYLDWLLGRGLRERDRSPCYQRIRSIFVRRLLPEKGKLNFPSPPWVTGHHT